MKTDANVVDKKGNLIVQKITRKKSISRKKPRVSVPPMAVQKLFDVCREVFKGSGTVPSPDEVQALRLILDKMKPEDVGLSRDLPSKFKTLGKETPRINYTTIYSCSNFSLCIFFLPPSAVIPLHNHPGMTVFSKLLLGKIHIKAYDWADSLSLSDSMPTSKLRLARLKVDAVFTAPCNTCILYPASGGNIHTFKAITPCIVLDVLGPPYSKEDDRDCTYYRDFPYSSVTNGHIENKEDGNDGYGWLEEIETPKDLKIEGIEYLGPQIIDRYG